MSSATDKPIHLDELAALKLPQELHQAIDLIEFSFEKLPEWTGELSLDQPCTASLLITMTDCSIDASPNS